jgi:hypothetical protein
MMSRLTMGETQAQTSRKQCTCVLAKEGSTGMRMRQIGQNLNLQHH